MFTVIFQVPSVGSDDMGNERVTSPENKVYVDVNDKVHVLQVSAYRSLAAG